MYGSCKKSVKDGMKGSLAVAPNVIVVEVMCQSCQRTITHIISERKRKSSFRALEMTVLPIQVPADYLSGWRA